MKIIAGTFGLKGSAFISGGRLHVESSKAASYLPSQVSSVDAGEMVSKGFSLGRALFGVVVLGLLLALIGGGIGLLAGVLLGALGGFAAEKNNAAEVAFVDGNRVKLLCTDRALNKLIRFKG